MWGIPGRQVILNGWQRSGQRGCAGASSLMGSPGACPKAFSVTHRSLAQLSVTTCKARQSMNQDPDPGLPFRWISPKTQVFARTCRKAPGAIHVLRFRHATRRSLLRSASRAVRGGGARAAPQPAGTPEGGATGAKRPNRRPER